MHIAIPTTLPWSFQAGQTVGLIVEADGTTVMAVSVTENTTAHADFYKNLGYLVHAANQLGQLQAERDQLRNELEMHRMQANKQNMMAGRVMERLQGRRDQLERTLRAVRMMIDGTQPKDLPGAVMAINAALPAPQEPGQPAGECSQVHPDSGLPSYRPGEHPEAVNGGSPC